MDTGSEHVLGYVRGTSKDRLLVLANFSEVEQIVPSDRLRLYGMSYQFHNLVNNEPVPFADIRLAPYAFLVLKTE